MTSKQVAETLHQHPAAKDIGQLGHVFAVGNRLVERPGKIGANQQGEVGIITLPAGIAVAVNGNDRVATAGALHNDLAGGTHAECPYAVVKAW